MGGDQRAERLSKPDSLHLVDAKLRGKNKLESMKKQLSPHTDRVRCRRIVGCCKHNANFGSIDGLGISLRGRG